MLQRKRKTHLGRRGHTRLPLLPRRAPSPGLLGNADGDADDDDDAGWVAKPCFQHKNCLSLCAESSRPERSRRASGSFAAAPTKQASCKHGTARNLSKTDTIINLRLQQLSGAGCLWFISSEHGMTIGLETLPVENVTHGNVALWNVFLNPPNKQF